MLAPRKKLRRLNSLMMKRQ